MLSIPQKKLLKLKELIKLVFSQKYSERRLYARILGKFYAMRAVLMKNCVSFASLLFKTRHYLYKDFKNQTIINELKQEWFHSKVTLNKECYKKFFDSKIPANPEFIKDEINLAWYLANQKAKFAQGRENLNRLGLPPITTPPHHDLTHVFTDASSKQLGVAIFTNEDRFTWSNKIPQKLLETSINLKETLAVLYGILLVNMVDKSNHKIVIHIDNVTAISISSTYRVNCKSLKLAILAKLIMHVKLASERDYYFRKIPTGDNSLADMLSRDENVKSRIVRNFDIKILCNMFEVVFGMEIEKWF